LKEEFSKYGEVCTTYVHQDKEKKKRLNFGFIYFKDENDAKKLKNTGEKIVSNYYFFLII
jgi:RNA recognition motif-containing protein